MSAWLLGALLACGGPSPAEPAASPPGGGPAPSGAPGPAAGGPVVHHEASALDPAWAADERAFREALVAAAARCRAEVADGLDAARAEAASPVLPEGALEAGCGDGWRIYDTWAPRIGGRTRSGDVVLTAAARLGDDLDYLARARDDVRDRERRNAVEHLHGALADVDRLLGDGADGPQSWDGSSLLAPVEWLRSVRSDEHGVGSLQEHFHRLAFQQGTQRRFLRLRMLEAALRTATRDVESRRAGLEATDGLDPAERAAREAYQQVAEEAAAVYGRIFARYDGGEVTSHEIMVEVRAQGQAAHDAWQAAWDAEVARSP
ncbi:MAG: hypothetical protein H6732_07225 [Alphaproteobacteria bacterium]|nr:hypothetical protein [Alphaproteobacteria bacterium]